MSGHSLRWAGPVPETKDQNSPASQWKAGGRLWVVRTLPPTSHGDGGLAFPCAWEA